MADDKTLVWKCQLSAWLQVVLVWLIKPIHRKQFLPKAVLEWILENLRIYPGQSFLAE